MTSLVSIRALLCWETLTGFLSTGPLTQRQDSQSFDQQLALGTTDAAAAAAGLVTVHSNLSNGSIENGDMCEGEEEEEYEEEENSMFRSGHREQEQGEQRGHRDHREPDEEEAAEKSREKWPIVVTQHTYTHQKPASLSSDSSP